MGIQTKTSRFNAAMQARAHRKPPPFGKFLFHRQLFNNPPFLITICVGAEAFKRAQEWNARGVDFAGLVLPDTEPEGYVWPMAGSLGLIDWDQGPSDGLITRLADCLHQAGALSVASRCLFEDPADWDHGLNRKTGKWDRLRHGMHFYRFDR